MDQLSNFISEYLKTCETIKKLNSKTIKAYRIDCKRLNFRYDRKNPRLLSSSRSTLTIHI